MNTLVTLVRSSMLAAGLALACSVSAQNLLTNPDFAGSGNGWGTFGAAGFTDFFGQNTEAAFFSDNDGNGGGLFQDVAGTAGLEYTFTILAMRIETNTNPTISYGLEFRDAGNALISFAGTVIDYGSVSRNDNNYSPASVSGIAPTGTAVVRSIIGYSDTVAGSNFFFVFDTDLTAATPVPEPASFAALTGLGALGCVALRRRRRA
ncbi:MAG: PEP-CTERM sorting domain-containing protein [Verrucomicrobiota bacterium]